MKFAVCGLYMSSAALNYQLKEATGRLVKVTKTLPNYHMYALSCPGTPTKPGIVYRPLGGPDCAALTVEVWDIPEAAVGVLLAQALAPIALGNVVLQDGSIVKGFVCEGWAADPVAAEAMGVKSVDITSYGGWREWRSRDDLLEDFVSL